MKHQRFIELLNRYADKTITVDEIGELQSLLSGENETDLIKELSETWISESNLMSGALTDITVSDEKAENILSVDKIEDNDAIFLAPVRSMSRRWYWIAAAIIFIIGAGFFWWMHQQETVLPQEEMTLADDIGPGKEGAILVLADGSEIILDSAGKGNLAHQGNMQVVKLENGELAYVMAGDPDAATGELLYNTMKTPPGNQYRLVLSDGTRVWLNASSSITYPAVFAAKERNVSISGEAYFEVAKNVSKPFIINVDNQFDIEVLGTSFNVNAYRNERTYNTTLLEGSVRIRGKEEQATSEKRILLKPGEQAQVQHNGSVAVVKDVNKEKVMAWRNGLFDFQDARLEEVMREIARWYDIEVIYEGAPPSIEFVGKISRDLSLSQVLNGLKGTGFEFRIEGRKLFISN